MSDLYESIATNDTRKSSGRNWLRLFYAFVALVWFAVAVAYWDSGRNSDASWAIHRLKYLAAIWAGWEVTDLALLGLHVRLFARITRRAG